MSIRVFMLFVLVWFPAVAAAQETESLYKKAVQLEKEYKQQEALEIYFKLLQRDSSDIRFLNGASHLLSMRNYEGVTREEQEKIYHKAEFLARKAIRLESTNAHAHFNLALALGRLSDKAPIKVKINYANEIRASCERAILLNRNLAGPYHILGRWHQEVAGFTVVERAFIATFYGKTPEGSYAEALKNLKISLRLDPHNPIHHYEIAHTYFHRNQANDHQYAREWLRLALALPAQNPEDIRTHKKAKRMLKKLQGE